MKYVIHNLESLQRLKTDKTIKSIYRKIQLDITTPDSEAYTRKLNRYYFSCGCQEGAVTVLISLLSVFVIYFTGIKEVLGQWWYLPLYLVGAAIFGKLFGLINKKIVLDKIIAQLKEEFKYSKSHSDPVLVGNRNFGG